jgi:hypothetical protein
VRELLTDSRGIPLAREFRGDETLDLVEILTPLDDLGRAMFRAYWLTDQPWVPGGVRAQVFNTNVALWVSGHRQRGRTVRSTDGSDLPCE